ncbi:hypothetical protein O3M35_002181 [Rhynocoris fuscipes]|uniref:Uncharacterized protein n=1 Tax=Rhynocoris fuscipes TaxID=488301 RepID=A0AAW1CRY9_9HEMI
MEIKPIRGDFSRRCASLRGRATPPSSSTPTPTAPKKTNWEVIEHFTGSSGPGQTPHRLRSASLIASHNADSILEEDEDAATGEGIGQDSLLLAETDGTGARVVLVRKKTWSKVMRRMLVPHRFKNLQVGNNY